MILLVAYDLTTPNDTPENYELIIGAIKSKFKSWCRIEQSVWLVDTGLEAAAVRDTLKLSMHKGDVLFVGRMSGGWASWNFGDRRNEWLKGRTF